MYERDIFLAATFEEAAGRANAKLGWLIVWATSANTAPAVLMEKTTWKDRVLAEHLITNDLVVVRVDVDEDRDLATALNVFSTPTVLAFKDGEEKGRLQGFRDPLQILMWWTALSAPDAATDTVIRPDKGDGEEDMYGRVALAKAMLQEERYGEATELYVWLWNNIARVDPDMVGVRVSFMADQIAKLVAAYPPAYEAFRAIRDDVGSSVTPASMQLRHDWIVLNKVLADDDRTVAWFDGLKRAPGWQDLAEAGGPELKDILRARGRVKDIGALYRDPLRELALLHSLMADEASDFMANVLGWDIVTATQNAARARFRTDVAELWDSLLAAGRDLEASEVRNAALRLDSSDEMRQALDAAVSH